MATVGMTAGEYITENGGMDMLRYIIMNPYSDNDLLLLQKLILDEDGRSIAREIKGQ